MIRRLGLLDANGAGGLLLALVLALAYVRWGFPPGFIRGVSSFWLMETQDITQYVAGFMAFFQEPWRWPLLRIERLNWPEGTLATFVDAIPLYALLLKALVPASVGPFNPYGFWIGLCLLLQAVGCWWALREAQVNRWAALLALTCLLLTMPVLQHRLGHVSLFSQWILVFAIALTLRSERLGQTSAGWSPLLLAALYINTYLTAMAALFYAVDLWRHRGQPGWLRWALWPLLTAVLAALSLWVMVWPLPGHHAAQDGGFGVYSMNLLAPITGSRFFALTHPTVSEGQAVEGFNYLGLGVMLLLAWLWRQGRTVAPTAGPSADDAAASAGSGKAPVLARPGALWLLLGLLTLYALSNQITFGPVQIASWVVPDFAAVVTGSLRASGRFFWPVLYVATIFGVIAAARRLDGRSLLLLLGAVAALQVADRWQAIQSLRGTAAPADAFRLHQAAWQTALGDAATIYFYPKARCARNASFYTTLLPVMRYAAERGMALSTGYIARYAPDCAAMADESRSSDPRRSAYVFVNDEYTAAQIKTLLPEAPGWRCSVVDFATVCRAFP